ncbi:hypothetical protein H2248_005759 [Termitomyces sp. 'cryptogamus']|nr:hypothetical protein H2248_005759 [Termitomyces sp. 'cryptogamus']
MSTSLVSAAESYPLTINSRRRAALQEIDIAPFTWFHARVCLVAGIGFFTDAYDIFAINIASVMLGYVYGPQDTHQLNTKQNLGIKVATPIGTLLGQLVFGWLADRVGRKRMYGIELMIIIVATFAQSLSGSGRRGGPVGTIGVLIVWRFLMGIGIGGDYPLSAVISSEFAPMRVRGRMMAAVFSSQGWGAFVAALVALITVAAYHESILANPAHVDDVWRILIGLGCVPGCIGLYYRLTIPETPRFTMDIERNVQQASDDIRNVLTTGTSTVDPDAPICRVNAPKATWADFRAYFGQWKNGKVLLGTAWSWFALDIAFYGLGLNNSVLLNVIDFDTPSSTGSHLIYNTLLDTCINNLIFSAGGLLPGYYFAFLFIDSWGRKPIQLMGFTILAILFIVLGFGYDKLNATDAAKRGFIVLVCFANFFQNFGPNTTTFTVPGEVFPTRYRSTAHGISAASGKFGAVVAQVVLIARDVGGPNRFIKHILEIFAFFMLTGILSTLLIPETKGLSLEELSNEKQEGFIRSN